MVRRLAASLLLLVTMSSALAGPALASEPDVLDLVMRSGPGLSSGTANSPKVHPDRVTQTAPGANGRLVFGRAPFLELPIGLWSMTSTGADPQAVTPPKPGFGDLEPAYSPGGTMIAFARDVTPDEDELTTDIFVMQANGTGIKRLTTAASNNSNPEWTPDGSRIVFTGSTGSGDIYSMKVDGTDVRRLTSNAATDSYASVSPDGKKIAFASDRTGEFDIYTMNMDGSGLARITTHAESDSWPDWSPDGTKIAFTSLRDGEYEIYVMNANGTGQTNLTNDPDFLDLEPTWSPDGTQIAFWSYRDPDADVYVMAATGGTQTAIGATAEDEISPDWQPIPAFPLVDARFSTFKTDIEWVYAEGITVGCSAERYCPNDPVTREQMAIFLDRALDLPPTATDYFSDDTGRSGEAAINRLRAANITTGCAVGLYCPTELVSRGQMASFLARAFALPPTTTDFFTDDTGTTHEANINRVAEAGITSGCSPTTYCPTASVTRGQMAAFLRRALEE